MNLPKVRDEDYINFIIATPRIARRDRSLCVSAGEQRRSGATSAFTRLLSRLKPDPETLWTEAKTQIDLKGGILVLDDRGA